MATNATFIAENTELNESLLFSIQRVGFNTWECSLPWATLSDFISTLTAAQSAGVPSITRGSVYQVTKIATGGRVKVDVQWLGIQSVGSFLTIFSDEIASLVSVLTDLSYETDTPIDLGNPPPMTLPFDQLPLPDLSEFVNATIETGLTPEAAQAIADTPELSATIGAETARATAAENQLTADLSAETTRATASAAAFSLVFGG